MIFRCIPLGSLVFFDTCHFNTSKVEYHNESYIKPVYLKFRVPKFTLKLYLFCRSVEFGALILRHTRYTDFPIWQILGPAVELMVEKVPKATYRGQKTPVILLLSAIYRGPTTPFITIVVANLCMYICIKILQFHWSRAEICHVFSKVGPKTMAINGVKLVTFGSTLYIYYHCII